MAQGTLTERKLPLALGLNIAMGSWDELHFLKRWTVRYSKSRITLISSVGPGPCYCLILQGKKLCSKGLAIICHPPDLFKQERVKLFEIGELSE